MNSDFTVIKLPKPLQDYLDERSGEGNRNERLKNAAMQARDCRWSEEATMTRLLPLAVDRDGLPEREVAATIRSMFSRPARLMPHGASGEAPAKITFTKRSEKPVKHKEIDYELESDFKLPEPMLNGPMMLLENLYNSGEFIFFQGARYDPAADDEKEKPDPYMQDVWARDALLKILKERTGGELGKIEGFDARKGLYFAINPVNKTSHARKKEDIAEYRYALIEFDTIPKEEQYQLLIKSKIPLAAITDSGHASIHGIVKINAGRDEALFKARREVIVEHFRKYNPDTNTADITRLSRFPGVVRADFDKGAQHLLSLAVGLPSWEEWETEIIIEKDGLPAIEDMFNLVSDLDAGKLVEPKEVIVGIAHEGCKLGLSAASKAKKTWVLADLAASVCSGTKWFNHLQCNKGPVLYLNMELPKFFMAKRVKMILDAKGLKLEPGMFQVINLRGFAAHLQELRPKLEHAIEHMPFSLILLDPTYKLMPGGDENGTGDTSSLLNEMERLAVKSGALVAFASHFSKGNQSAKNAIDRSSGSSVFGRDPDSIIVMTEHKEHDALTIDLILRNHAPTEQFVIKWETPLFQIDKDLDPSALAEDPTAKGKKKEKEEHATFLGPADAKRLSEFKEYLAANPADSKNKVVEAGMRIFKLSKPTFVTRLHQMITDGQIKVIDTGIKSGRDTTKNYVWVEKTPEPEPESSGVGKVGK
jgi:RecA-family ATPase